MRLANRCARLARFSQSLRTQRRYFVLDALRAALLTGVFATPMTLCQCQVVCLNCRIARNSDVRLLAPPASAGASRTMITSADTRTRKALLRITNNYSLRDNDDRWRPREFGRAASA